MNDWSLSMAALSRGRHPGRRPILPITSSMRSSVNRGWATHAFGFLCSTAAISYWVMHSVTLSRHTVQ